jgi:hypothetical protein
MLNDGYSTPATKPAASMELISRAPHGAVFFRLRDVDSRLVRPVTLAERCCRQGNSAGVDSARFAMIRTTYQFVS